MKTIRIKLTTTEEMLGMSPSDKEIYDTFIASKNPNPVNDENESDYIPEDLDVKGKTIFPVLDDGTPFFWNYQIKGFFKDACSMLARVVEKDENGKKKKGLNESAKLTSYKKVIDGLIFVSPRKIPIILPEGADIGTCQRPLRAQTAQGERIALAASDAIPAGAQLTFDVKMLSDDHEKVLLEWLEYGELRGLGQWRNSGKGTFTFEILAAASGITLDQKELKLKVKQSEVLVPTVTPDNAENKSVVWKSTNTSVATVDTNGEVTAVGKGTAEIVATTVDGGFKATSKVVVK